MTEFRKGARVQSGYYGRGTVEEVMPLLGQAFVQFDGDPCRRRVHVAHLLPEHERTPPTSAPPLPPIRPRYRLLVVR